MRSALQLPQLTALREIPGYDVERGTKQSLALSLSRGDRAERTGESKWLESIGKSTKRERVAKEREHHRSLKGIFKYSTKERTRNGFTNGQQANEKLLHIINNQGHTDQHFVNTILHPLEQYTEEKKNSGNDKEKQEPQHTASGNTKWFSCYGNSLDIPRKVKHGLTIRPQFHIQVYPPKNQKQVLKTVCVCTHVCIYTHMFIAAQYTIAKRQKQF